MVLTMFLSNSNFKDIENSIYYKGLEMEEIYQKMIKEVGEIYTLTGWVTKCKFCRETNEG